MIKKSCSYCLRKWRLSPNFFQSKKNTVHSAKSSQRDNDKYKDSRNVFTCRYMQVNRNIEKMIDRSLDRKIDR